MEAFGIETGKDPPEGVMRGDTIGEVEELLEPRLFAFAKEFPSTPCRSRTAVNTKTSIRRGGR